MGLSKFCHAVAAAHRAPNHRIEETPTMSMYNTGNGTPMEAQASPPTAHRRAVTALVCGVLSLVLCGIFTGIPAILLGRSALRDIAASNGRIGGRGMARAGLITGIIGTALWLLGLIFVVLFAFGGPFGAN
jgi:hypothetical protein